jgi:hypothetical protein
MVIGKFDASQVDDAFVAQKRTARVPERYA